MTIIVKVMGGLASQLHKYAVGRALSIKYNQELKLDLTWFYSLPMGDTPRQLLLDKFHTQYATANDYEIAELRGSKLRSWLANRLISVVGLDFSKNTRFSGARIERLIRFPREISLLQKGAYVEGELVGDYAFSHMRTTLLKEFSLRDMFITKEVQRLVDQMKVKQSVAFHIRRGDYVSNIYTSNYHVTCDIPYFTRAIDFLRKEIGNNFRVYIFSDDIPWVRMNLAHFPDGAVVVDNFSDEQNFYLLSKCNHFVISNSGFSWLASWLGCTADSVVIGPEVWLKDPQKNSSHVGSIVFEKMVLVNNE